MMKKEIRLYGAGGHSEVIKDILIENGYDVTDVYDDNFNESSCQTSIVSPGIRNNKNNFPHQGSDIIITLGVNKYRYEISKILKSSFGKAIHSSSVIAKNVIIGEGTVIIAGAVINVNSIIGKHVIVNTSASIGHDCIVEDFVHISPNVALCGHVEVGFGTQIGAGSVVVQEVKVGKWCIVGAGTVVINDIPDYSVVVGNPGRIIKSV